MKVLYRGYEITVTKEKSLGGWTQTYYSIFRESDGYECLCDFEETSDTVQQSINHMKDRIDRELKTPDPWGEIADEEYLSYNHNGLFL